MPVVRLALRFDHPGARDFRFLQEAARLGEVQALLWSDQAILDLAGVEPGLPEAERLYFLQAIRSLGRHRRRSGIARAAAGSRRARPGPVGGG